jgi:hypothetical protein
VNDTTASTSRIILNAGEVVFTGNYGKSAGISYDTARWEVRDGFGLYIRQEMDGWWSMHGIMNRISPVNPYSSMMLLQIESDFARPFEDVIMPIVCSGLWTISGPYDVANRFMGSLQVSPSGSVKVQFPRYIPYQENPSAVASNKEVLDTNGSGAWWGDTPNSDWVSLGGVRWRAKTIF